MSDDFDLPEISRTEKSMIVGEGIAEMMTTEEGRALLLEITAGLRPSILDASRADLVEADRRARMAVSAMNVILRGWSWGGARTLGELMPQLPEDVRELVAERLVRAGLS